MSFNKGSFQEQEDLESLMEAIQIEISAKGFDLYSQAEKYIKPKTQEANIKVAKGIVKKLKNVAKQNNLNAKIDASLSSINNKRIETKNEKALGKAKAIDSHEEIIDLGSEKYKLNLELITEKDIPTLYSISIFEDELFSKMVTYKINLAHPFLPDLKN